MDSIDILNVEGDYVDPATVRVTHSNRVLSPDTQMTITVAPLDSLKRAYPVAEIVESPPVRCHIYDWFQWINFSLQRQFGNIITGKEQQLRKSVVMTVYPARQASFCRIDSAAWTPVYTDEPAETRKLYNLLDRLINRPAVEFEDDDIVSTTFTRVLPNGDRRTLPNGDVRIGIAYG